MFERGRGLIRRDDPPADGAPADPPATTPAHRDPLPQPGKNGTFRIQGPEYFLNRELTWLNFNDRVLHEAKDPRTPLLERVKFVAIVDSNLDEFFMKRIGGLRQQVGAGMTERTVDGRTAAEQIGECLDVVRDLRGRQRAACKRLIKELRTEEIELLEYDDLSPGDRKRMRKVYEGRIHPLVTPQATDPAHPFPFISNLSLNLLVSLRYPSDAEMALARIKVPLGAGMPRFLRVPGGDGGDRFVRVEAVMAHNLDLLFPGMEVESCTVFRVTRNANTERDEERADDLLAMIEEELRDRKFAPVVRLEIEKGADPMHRELLLQELELTDGDAFSARGMLGMRDLQEIATLARPGLRDAPHHPVEHPRLSGDRSVFAAIQDAGSILLHHPYQSYATSVERFLRAASRDDHVRAIKMALYRTSERSKVIEYLVDAARHGKQVAVVVELKARFDEEANIRWANRLEEAGIHVTYGVVGLKTHCKVILVVRQEEDGLTRYCHLGTGNYHADTARLYSDIGLLTCDPDIGADSTELLNYLTTGFKPKRTYRKLLPAPKQCKAALLSRIKREIEGHSVETPGLIQIKTNALEDPDVTHMLYRASQAGVHVDLIVRDTCRLRPGIPGLSDNVRVVSIVGRFLEHARVYYFRNAGGGEEYFIGSADCMRRNLENRVEILVPVEDPALREELRMFLDLQLADRRSAWEMRPDGSYIQLRPEPRAGDRPEEGAKRIAEEATSSHVRMAEWAEKKLHEVTRLRRRKPRGIQRRNVR